MTKVVNKERGEDVVYIGRGSMWGNPFYHGNTSYDVIEVKSRAEAVKGYFYWIAGFIDMCKFVSKKCSWADRDEVISNMENLKNKKLSCYCSPKLCHGDVLVYFLDKFDGQYNSKEKMWSDFLEWKKRNTIRVDNSCPII